MGPEVAGRLFAGPHRARLTALARTDPDLVAHDLRNPSPAVRDALATAEVLLTCWGAPVLDAGALAAAPGLRAVVHAAGSVKGHLTDACWERGIVVSSAASANAVPVAEYTLAAILFAGKRVLSSARRYARLRAAHDWGAELAGAGNHRRTVGIVGASRTGRRVVELLRPFDLDVLLYDPYTAAPPGAVQVGLDELCARSDTVSVHAPELPETRHLLDARRLALLPDGATLINTARGSLVEGPALVRELVSGRLYAVLDVTEPEVPPPDSPLYSLPNVLLTPHLAGSLGTELHRLADLALDELERYAKGLPFAEPVTRDSLNRSA
ncbi:hydroxyacid dehydrogenase [Streptomyces qinzhouensis]|uniref:Hydroxyacid dehydrogenase n=1 Tax=Streptomyces qinzhouensis TaxID=2599401 RepID=A0A5B8IR70_9ACTN|nr:hydroxyacid dehydrogenase [Streptomyces qinzhouensis]QDY81188.1 hydroxyacid dehydrogenase [Streptomyces qinzhouensis]